VGPESAVFLAESGAPIVKIVAFQQK